MERIADALRQVAQEWERGTDSARASRCHPPAAVNEDDVRYLIADALKDVASRLVGDA